MDSVDSFGGSFDVVGAVSDSGSGGSPVPEPPGALLLAVGLCALCAIKVRRTYFQPRTELDWEAVGGCGLESLSTIEMCRELSGDETRRLPFFVNGRI